MSILEKYEQRAKAIDSLVCVGLDSDYDRIPDSFKTQEFPQFAFNRWIIAQTAPYAAAYKPNMAFYEARGEQGLHELQLTMDDLHANHPGVFTICDAKRADIGSTNAGYVTAIFDRLGFDAITLHPYLGAEALAPFLARKDKASIILCRTSNPGAGELQDLQIDGKPLWHIIAEKVRDEWNTHENCLLVAGATYPDELRQIRETVGEMTLLVPGIGAQGGDIAATVKAGLNNRGSGLIINASRSILFADSPAEAARELRDTINQYR